MTDHSGHRARKRRQFRDHGIDAFADHEVLELLLYYAVPRRDTNPIAHALMDRFGSLNAVLSAPAEELELTYRHSALEGTGRLVTAATVRLTPAEPEAIRERMRELIEKRRASQPLDMPSAGSTFKRPAVGYAAALIDQAGLKGFAVGGAQVSEKHAGFVINRGGATFDDVVQLMEHIQKTVFEKSGVRLEPEVRILKG